MSIWHLAAVAAAPEASAAQPATSAPVALAAAVAEAVPLVTLHGSCTLEPPTATSTQELTVATAVQTLMAQRLPTVPMLSWTTPNMRTSKEVASDLLPATIRMMLAGRMETVVMTAARAAQQVLPASAAPTAL
jgi:hypothetical protein